MNGSFLRRLLGRTSGLIGASIITLLAAAALLSLVWTPHDPAHAVPSRRWQPPSLDFWLGTDASGRDIFSLLLAGSRTTVVVAVAGGILATLVGVLLASAGALTRRRVRESVAVLIDVLIAFPTVILAMMLASVMGGSLAVVVVAIGVSAGVNIARVTRGELRRIARSDYILIARANGLRPGRILREHLLPGVAGVFIVQLSWTMATAVLAEAGLSYLGYGAPAGTPSWGRLLAELQTYITVHPLSVLGPGLAITITVLGFTLLGDGLRDAIDPRLRRDTDRAPRTVKGAL